MGLGPLRNSKKGLGLGPKKADEFAEFPGSETMELLADTDPLIHLAMGAGAMCLIEQTWGLIL